MKTFEYGIAEFDRIGGTIASYMHLPVHDVTATSVPDFLVNAGEQGWELCATMPGPSPKGSKVHDPASPGGIRIVEDLNETTVLIFKRPR